MKSIANWRIQTGATIGFIEQLLGSNTISGAFFTQAKLRSFNILALALILLWSLSPLGSQASLRVVSVVDVYPSNTSTLTAMNTFAEYAFGFSEGLGEAVTLVRSPFTAAIMSANILKNRNQDLWGNIRLPSIESLTSDGNTDWVNISDPTNVQYPSLVGVPVTSLPTVGNTTFALSGSYLNVTCGVLELQSNFTDFTGANAPKPGGNTDCTWEAFTALQQLQLALSIPCKPVQINNGTRDARKLIWESSNQDYTFTHAECELYTTYVEVNMECAGSSCLPTSVKRSPQPPGNLTWTVFDFESGMISVSGFLQLFTGMFPGATVSGGEIPTVAYLVNPYNAIAPGNTNTPYSVGKTLFETRLAQMLNTQLVLGISPPDVVGGFNSTLQIYNGGNGTNIIATTSIQQRVMHCNRAWLVILALASLTLIVAAFIPAILRHITLVPDVLGTLSLGMLNNQTHTLVGNSAWNGWERAGKMRNVKVRLGDIRPGSDIGQIGLGGPLDTTVVSEVRAGRLYR
jgi:hypothetical protein